jgi:hypothetical protein
MLKNERIDDEEKKDEKKRWENDEILWDRLNSRHVTWSERVKINDVRIELMTMRLSSDADFKKNQLIEHRIEMIDAIIC